MNVSKIVENCVVCEKKGSLMVVKLLVAVSVDITHREHLVTRSERFLACFLWKNLSTGIQNDTWGRKKKSESLFIERIALNGHAFP